MSNSLNNYIGITDKPDEMFGKLMSVSDDLMWRYFELLSFKPLSQIEGWKREMQEGKNPRDIKFELAMEIVDRFHEVGEGEKAKNTFIERFQQGAMPEDMPEVTVEAVDGSIAIANLLKQANLVNSTSDALRMIKQGAVKIDGEKISDAKLQLKANSEHVYQVGKHRFAKVAVA